MTSIIVWDIPTLLLVNSFSFFAYYMAKLNIEVERLNSSEDSNRLDNFFPARDGGFNDEFRNNQNSIKKTK